MENKKRSLIDLLLHPVRMRILLVLTGEQMSPRELAEALDDIPQATLYRHLRALTRAGILEIVAERPVRGVMEKIYTINARQAGLGLQDLADLSKEEHLQMFVAFTTTLLKEFQHYLDNVEKIDYLADGIGYRQIPIYLSDDELMQMSTALNKALLPFLQNQPGPNRRRRIFSTVMMPARIQDRNQNSPEDIQSDSGNQEKK